jgi:hypothetical protein
VGHSFGLNIGYEQKELVAGILASVINLRKVVLTFLAYRVTIFHNIPPNSP